MTAWTPGAGERAIEEWKRGRRLVAHAKPLTIRERIAAWKLQRVARTLGLDIA